jgi:hypothetical protein
VEVFNSCFRQECRNEHWFMSLSDAEQKIVMHSESGKEMLS